MPLWLNHGVFCEYFGKKIIIWRSLTKFPFRKVPMKKLLSLMLLLCHYFSGELWCLQLTNDVSGEVWECRWAESERVRSNIFITMIILLQVVTKDTPWLAQKGETWNVLCELIVWSISMSFSCCIIYHIYGLVQERRNSIANALELHLSCTSVSTL